MDSVSEAMPKAIRVTHDQVGLPGGKQATFLNLTYADIILNCTQLLREKLKDTIGKDL
jgi:hypothetical protein